jgi:hypothetical protein
VDTRSEVHVAAALDPVCGLLGTREFPATAAGYAGLLGWLEKFGDVALVGVEGTGSYGAGLARYLAKRSARHERTQAVNQARALILTGPDELRARFAGLRAAGTERPRPGGQRLEKRTRTLPGSAAAAGCLVQGTGPEPVVSPSRRVHGPRKGGLPRLPRPGRVPGLGSASR